jgi:hypothetical protein
VRKPSTKSLLEGIFVLSLGGIIFILIPTQVEEIPGMETIMSPSALPTIISIILIILGAGLIFQSLRMAVPKPSQEIPKQVVFRVVISVILLILNTILLSHLGFVVTSSIFLGIFAFLFGSRNIAKIIFSMTFIPILIWLFIEKLFNIPLPRGIFF